MAAFAAKDISIVSSKEYQSVSHFVRHWKQIARPQWEHRRNKKPPHHKRGDNNHGQPAPVFIAQARQSRRQAPAGVNHDRPHRAVQERQYDSQKDWKPSQHIHRGMLTHAQLGLAYIREAPISHGGKRQTAQRWNENRWKRVKRTRHYRKAQTQKKRKEQLFHNTLFLTKSIYADTLRPISFSAKIVINIWESKQ